MAMFPPPTLRRLTLRGFRSFRSGSVEFDNPTFLVGRNGSGKSNLADAFAFLAEAMELPLGSVFARRGGVSAVGNRTEARGRPAHLGLHVELAQAGFDATYAFEGRATHDDGFEVLRERCEVRPGSGPAVWFDRRPSAFRSSLPSLEPRMDDAALILPLMGGDTRFGGVCGFLSGMRVCQIEPASLRDLQDPDGGHRLLPTGRNAASVLRKISREAGQDWETLLELLRIVDPGTSEVIPRRHGNKLTLEFVQDLDLPTPIRFPATNISDGTLRVLGLLAAVFQRPAPSLLVIEEPEVTMHPDAIGVIFDLLRVASGSMQVVVTTHSTDLLEAKWIRDHHLRIVVRDGGATRVHPLSDSAGQALRDRLMNAGELFRANALTPQPFAPPPEAPKLSDPLPA